MRAVLSTAEAGTTVAIDRKTLRGVWIALPILPLRSGRLPLPPISVLVMI
ncbi:hypothetical protein [Ideonella sp.]|nr:hypothetical protein [Ideonella sp.]